MNRIIDNEKKVTEIISIKEALLDSDANNIIAYLTNNGTGVGILQNPGLECWGFFYHSDLVLGRTGHLKFEASTKRGAIHNAVSIRAVYSFQYFPEFLAFAAKHSKL